MIKKILILSLFAILVGCSTQSDEPLVAEAPIVPMKDFFKNAEKRSYQLSPDGKFLAFMQPDESRMNVHIQKIGEDNITRVTHATERDISGYLWKGNDRIIYVQDSKGDENYRLFGVDKDGGNQKDLTPFEKVRVGIVDDLEENPTEMLISMNKRDARIFDVFRINVSSGEMKKIAENPGNITGWKTDHNGKLRIAMTTDGVNTSIICSFPITPFIVDHW